MDVVVLISADTEWRAVRQFLPHEQVDATPYGETISLNIRVHEYQRDILIMHGGWGKIAAGASAQYAIDRWRPKLLMNLGTCGGFEGGIERGEVVLVEKTLVYDIYEQMGDPGSHIDHYTTEIDLSWLEEPYPERVRRGRLVSGDKDLDPAEIGVLKRTYHAMAGDWESGAIAFVANRNETPLLILRGVSDLVSEAGGEAYGNEGLFDESAQRILTNLLDKLPDWLEAVSFFK
jgi:adenosylhomocysteine nucleosidase